MRAGNRNSDPAPYAIDAIRLYTDLQLFYGFAATRAAIPVWSHLSSRYFHQCLCVFRLKLHEALSTKTGSGTPFQQGPKFHC